MNDLEINEAAEKSEPIEPISSSADGKRNAYSLACAPTGQSMNYAACLWRQGVLRQVGVKTPADWSGCDAARKCGTCIAIDMRQEEELMGKSIYFKDRGFLQSAASKVKQWVMPVFGGKKETTKTVYRSPDPKKSSSMLDAMGAMGTYSDALVEAAKDPVLKARGIDGHRKIVPITSVPGESPLAMARRIAASRSTTI